RATRNGLIPAKSRSLTAKNAKRSRKGHNENTPLQNAHRRKGADCSAPVYSVLLRRQFFGLGLAFLPHQLERALGFFVGSGDFFLYFGRGLFHFWREAHVAVVLHAGAGRDEPSDDHVLLQAAQMVDLALNGGFGEHARGLLERGRRDEGFRRQRGFGDPQQQRTACRGFATLSDDALVLLAEAELVHLL